ncbi:MAG TPA: hypothetical protein VJT50_13355, partial [Pyrinomonadaceae bacterium]|nr:hypothetical protein [Pyrinomonadaceae bacterium]
MKKQILPALPVLFLSAIAVSAQVNPSISAVNTPKASTLKSDSGSDPATATRARVTSQSTAPKSAG